MPKKKIDKLCTRIDMCVSQALNLHINVHLSEMRLINEAIKKPEAAEAFVEMLFQFYMKNK